MKHIIATLVAVLAIAAGLGSCSPSDAYEYVYLRSVTVDNEDADSALVARALATLERGGLPVLTRDDMRALTPQQRIRTLKVKVDIDCRRNKVEADIDIENLQTDRDVWDTEAKAPATDPDAVVKALDQALDQTVAYLNTLAKNK